MTRSFSNRVLGGVCGGLASRTPFNATIWRLFFIVLTALTQGVGALVYLVWWWLLPQESPFEERRSAGGTLLALIVSVLLIAGYVIRDQLVTEAGADVYLPLVLLIMALVFLLRQFALPRGSVVTGAVLLLASVLVLLGAVGIIPPGLMDVLLRAAPALLIFFGLWIVLRDRVAAGSIVAVIVAVALAGGVAGLAFTSRVNEQRTENEVAVNQEIESEISLIQINVETLDSDVQFLARADGDRAISATYTGSIEHDLTSNYTNDGSGLATLTLREQRLSDYPLLESIGRGALRVELPEDVAVSVSYSGDRSTATFDMDELNLERLNIDLETGDVLVTLPAYQPLSPTVQENPGVWRVDDGNITARVPEDVGARFELSQSSNTLPLPGQNYNDLYFLVQVVGVNNWILMSQGYEGYDVRLNYIVHAPDGRLVVEYGLPEGDAS